jgi:hypothetical protein
MLSHQRPPAATTAHRRVGLAVATALVLPGTVLAGGTAAHGSAGPATSATEGSRAISAAGSNRPRAGNPDGHAPVPAAARPVDTSHPTRVVGRGTAASCTSAAVVRAVARGGLITFACGPRPVTITLTQTAKVRNDRRAATVIDGGRKVTLSGGGERRVLYMNTCDPALGITSSHCQDQSTPRLTLQNLTIARGDSTGQRAEGGGGGAVFVRGGRLKVVNSRFFRNRCDSTGPDLGGAAIRVLDQFDDLPVYIVHSTFGGAKGYGGRCSNGGALSSIGVSWVILNSVISHNQAVGSGANPARSGSPGGGSGAGIYTDGNLFTVTLEGTRMDHNHAREGGGAIFFVSNDRSGSLTIDHSVLRKNPSDGFETAGYPGIFFIGAGHPHVTGSVLR